jgi:hypothetical protein
MTYADPAMVKSNFERKEGDKYWTEHWITEGLIETAGHRGDIPTMIWEPAAGRGDITTVLLDHGYDVKSSDVEGGEFKIDSSFMIADFLEVHAPSGCRGIITNPPYTAAQEFVEHAIKQMHTRDVRFVAMLLRSEFKHAKKRKHLFKNCLDYAGEVCLTRRPRWDWWFRDKPVAAPRHNFSWFMWAKNAGFNSDPVQLFY